MVARKTENSPDPGLKRADWVLAFACTGLLLCASCTRQSPTTPPAVEVFKTPVAPAVNDAAYPVSGVRNWYLKQTAVTAGSSLLMITMQPVAGLDTARVWID